ncbi:reverse transcriptase [Tanacetum coccineum]|uniref:Reverse transcriptase n=1 Tax=Tanacetum coccineum TaxID=301880 RepID=A0ABQ4YEM2_9ASTR
MKEQLDSLHEAVKMTTQENTEVIDAAKTLVRNLGSDFKKEIEKMPQDLLSARKFVEDRQCNQAMNVKTLDDATAAAESIVDYSNRPRRPVINKSESNQYLGFRDEPENRRVASRRNGSIRRLGSLREMLSGVDTKEHGLLFTKLTINDKKTLGLIDTGATHNFLDVKEAEQLGVTYTCENGTIKTVNSKPKQIHGIAKVKVYIDKWTNKLTFTVVSLDDYRIVLGLDFFEGLF